jgi:hypothetical protein
MRADAHLAKKQASGAADDFPKLLLMSDQLAIVRQPDDVACLGGMKLGEQIVVVAFTVHHVNGTSR